MLAASSDPDPVVQPAGLESPVEALRDLASLPAVVAHEASNPLTSARASLQLTMESIGRWTDVGAGRRLEALDELGQVVAEIDRAVSFLRAVQDRARGAVARSERFDAVRVVRSCCTLESRVLKARSIPLVLETTLESVYLVGDPNAFYDLLVNLLRNAADATAGRPRVGLGRIVARRRRDLHRGGPDPSSAPAGCRRCASGRPMTDRAQSA